MTDDELRKAIRVVRHNPVADVNGAYGWEVDTAEGVLAEAAWRLAAYAEAQMGRRCENCRESKRLSAPDGVYDLGYVLWCQHAQVACHRVGHTCGAWAEKPKEDTRG